MVRVFQNAMNHYPVVPKESVQRVIIVTYFRSGSTFLGDILQTHPRSFYHFEPLHMYSNDARTDGQKARDGVALIKRILQCQFRQSSAYMNWVQKEKNQFLFRRNRFLWSHCGIRSPLCFKTEYVTRICERAPLHVMKITRLSVAQVKDLVEDKQFGSAKIVHLVRDPRGILASRKLLDWCRSSNCSDYRHLCGEMRLDLDAFDELQRAHPSQVFRVRYEDVSLNPENSTRSLFKGLGLPYSANVLMFLKTHTSAHKVDSLNPYSTRRNSSSVPFQWMKKLDFEYILEVQKSCKDVLFRLGYKDIDNAEQLDGPLPIGSMPERTPSEISNRVHRELGR
ncbi:carbohydrate sulfotransferase 3-like isoform X2 [Ornithodoros turicata]